VLKIRHLGTIAQGTIAQGTIAQLCRVMCSQLRHVSTIGQKVVKQRYLPHVFTIWWTSAH